MWSGSALRREWLGYSLKIASLVLGDFTCFFLLKFFLVLSPKFYILIVLRLTPLSLAFKAHHCMVLFSVSTTWRSGIMPALCYSRRQSGTNHKIRRHLVFINTKPDRF